MKWLFYLLLLANAVFFAHMQLAAERNGEAPLVHRQFYAEKIKLLNPKELLAVPVLKRAAKLENAPAVAKPAVCMEWGVFTGPELARAQDALDNLQLGDRLSQHYSEETVGYWVYIPPLKSKKDAENKIGELKTRGIVEYFLMQDNGPWHNAISLGMFKSEELARNYLAKLQARGVKSAVIGERNHQVKRTLFQIRDVGDVLATKFAQLRRDFPSSELKTVDCSKLESTSASR